MDDVYNDTLPYKYMSGNLAICSIYGILGAFLLMTHILQ